MKLKIFCRCSLFPSWSGYGLISTTVNGKCTDNISFDASLVIYIYSTNIPPIMIINRIYENQNILSLYFFSFLPGLRTYQHPGTRVKQKHCRLAQPLRSRQKSGFDYSDTIFLINWVRSSKFEILKRVHVRTKETGRKIKTIKRSQRFQCSLADPTRDCAKEGRRFQT